jgi:hypothetical protein
MEAWLKSLAEAALPPSVTRDLQEFSSTVWRDTTELAKEGLSMATSLASGGPAGAGDVEGEVASPAVAGAPSGGAAEAAPSASASGDAAPGVEVPAEGRTATAEGAAAVAAVPVADGARRDAPAADDDLPGWGDDEEEEAGAPPA